MRPAIALLAALALLPTALALPSPSGYVNDYANILGPDRASLESLVQEIERDTTAEIAVVIIPELPPGYTSASYAVELFQQWGIGKRGEDNGLLILLSLKEQKWRIEVGYGLEPFVVDAEAGRIGRAHLEPILFDSAPAAPSLRAAIEALRAELQSAPRASQDKTLAWAVVAFLIILAIAIIIGVKTGKIKPAKRGSHWVTSSGSGGFSGGGGFGGGGSGGGGAGN